MALEDLRSDPLLHLAVHVTFHGSARIGEMLGLTWDNVCLDPKDSYIIFNKALQRVKKDTLEKLRTDSLYFVFPDKVCTTSLILKQPKTPSSERKIYLTDPLREEWIERKKKYQLSKWLLGDDFNDCGLVFFLDNGDPIETKLCEIKLKKWYKRLKEKRYPFIKFQEFRHSSATYKLIISNGDYKAVQRETGHSQAQTLMDVYAHFMEDRNRLLTNKMNTEFYGPQEEAKEEENELIKS